MIKNFSSCFNHDYAVLNKKYCFNVYLIYIQPDLFLKHFIEENIEKNIEKK